jgi:photosystem II stability/assembly factor-like uncharacterized protein
MAKGARPHAEPPPKRGGGRLGWAVWLVVGLTVALGAFLLAREQATGGGEAVDPPARGLPHTPDYHALFVFPDDPDHLLLGTHVGIYESTDGGVRWRFLGLEGKDAMHFARDGDGSIWVAGHNVLARSDDGGRTWADVRPDGLPGLDIHGFAIERGARAFYAAVAGEGLYRSGDGGRSYDEVSTEVGPDVYALATTPSGLFAADRGRGVLVNEDDGDAAWEEALRMQAAGLAWNGLTPPELRVLAAGTAVQIYTPPDRWERVFSVGEGAGPVAFAPSDPEIAYLVGFDRRLYRSEDGGETWAVVA